MVLNPKVQKKRLKAGDFQEILETTELGNTKTTLKHMKTKMRLLEGTEWKHW